MLKIYQCEGRKETVNTEIQKSKSLEAELKKEKEENEKGKELINKIKRERDFYASELENVKKGFSFRIGRVITWLPRKLTGRK